MEPAAMHDPDGVRRSFARFTEAEAIGSSPILHGWSVAVADDDALLERLAELPPLKRQPNLLFAAARWHGVEAPQPCEWLMGVHRLWDVIAATMCERSTQTNEVGRWATLLPVLAGIEGPVALLEVGASAGLTLYPDRYSYRWTRDDGSVTRLDPAVGQSPVVVDARVHGDAPLPSHLPAIVWRAGIDLNPLDVADDDQMQWLQTLVWPEHEDRRVRLAAAVDVVRQDPPRLVAGDLNEQVVPLAAQAPSEATLVVFHSAVLAYLEAPERERFVSTVKDLPGHWISNEGPNVVPSVTETAPEHDYSDRNHAFVTGLDGRAVAFAQSHGREMWWL